ncbi:Monopolin complex subunit [Trichinella spiralis]|uniref:Monopolin complex subunit n=1 Tax=Trichinella spiralis TaxID=6334 RepID=A0ABR3KRK9_TRISP
MIFARFELLYLSSYAWFENTVHTELKNIQIYTTKPSVCLLAAAASCDKACAVISSTTMSNPNNERILCVDHNGNIIYLSREDLQRAYDTILETAVTEYSRRMGMHTGNVRESRSESTEMSGPLLQQQQHHQQHEEVEFSFPPWRCTCAPNVRFGAVPIRESSLQYQQLQLPEVYETNRGNSELLPQSTSDDDEWQSHEYVLPAIERLPYGNVEFGLISSSSTWDHNVRRYAPC